jgi:hypothetical protein
MLLADDIGLGKTTVALSILARDRARVLKRSTLVLCSAGLESTTWKASRLPARSTVHLAKLTPTYHTAGRDRTPPSRGLFKLCQDRKQPRVVDRMDGGADQGGLRQYVLQMSLLSDTPLWDVDRKEMLHQRRALPSLVS